MNTYAEPKLSISDSAPTYPSGQALPLQILSRPIAELKLDPDNPRIHAGKQVRQIARSIETFGFNVPVLIDRADKVIAGHGRILACRELGWTEAPTIRLDHLTASQEKAYMIGHLNRYALARKKLRAPLSRRPHLIPSVGAMAPATSQAIWPSG